MACLCHAPFSVTMARNSFVLIALAVVSALIPAGVFGNPLNNELDETLSSALTKEESQHQLTKRWTNTKDEEDFLSPLNQESSSFDQINLPPNQANEPEDRIYGIENKETSYTKDVRIFLQPDEQAYKTDSAQHNAEIVVIPLDAQQYPPHEENLSSDDFIREPRECPYLKKLKEIREEQSRRKKFPPTLPPYPYGDRMQAPRHRFYPSYAGYKPKRSVERVEAEQSDLVSLTDIQNPADTVQIGLHEINKRSVEGDKAEEETKSAVKCCQNEESLTGQAKKIVRRSADYLKNREIDEHVSKQLSSIDSMDLEAIEEAFDNHIQTAVKKCCDRDPDIAKLYEIAKSSVLRSDKENSRNHLEYNRQVTRNFLSSLKQLYQKSRGHRLNGHRVQKRGVNLVMGDPTYEELGLNPVRSPIPDCVNEMLEVPGITEQGMDWQIIGDHFRHYYTLMKDLQESYGLGLFSAIRELTNFHRWMKEGTLHGPFMSGPFDPFYYSKRRENGQPMRDGYVAKPVYGRTGPYSNYPPYVPLAEQDQESDY